MRNLFIQTSRRIAPVNILRRRYTADNKFRVDVFWQRKLNDDAMKLVIRIEILHNIQQVSFAAILWKAIQLGNKSNLALKSEGQYFTVSD